MTCTQLYKPVTFGWELHERCYGCEFASPYTYQNKDATVHRDGCPRKVNPNEVETLVQDGTLVMDCHA